MGDGNLKAQIAGIEAQLRVLRASGVPAGRRTKPGGLRAIKAALRGKGKFASEEIDGAKARFRNDA